MIAAASVAKADLRVDEWPHPSGVATFWLLRHADTDPADAASFDPGADLGRGANADVLASIVQQDAILYGMKTRPPLPPSVAARLVRAAVDKAKDASGVEKKNLTALVALPRLCSWARTGERWNDAAVLSRSNGEACEAAEAIALGRPREGHSVLGRGTFAAAEPAWVAALRRTWRRRRRRLRRLGDVRRTGARSEPPTWQTATRSTWRSRGGRWRY